MYGANYLSSFLKWTVFLLAAFPAVIKDCFLFSNAKVLKKTIEHIYSTLREVHYSNTLPTQPQSRFAVCVLTAC